VRVIAVTGSASGIGAALRARLETAGERVIGVDRRDAEVIADLGCGDGRAAAVACAEAACDGRLDGLVACAGVGPQVAPASAIVSIDYFGAQALLAGLRSRLAAAGGAAAVAVCSNSSTLPGADGPLAAVPRRDEEDARRLALARGGHPAYAGAKVALGRWVRRSAPGAEWAGAGVRLNAVAPGAVLTPLLQDGLEHPVFGPAIRSFPIPTGAFGAPEQIAGAIAFLLGPDAAFCCGSVLFVDGGTDALLRPDRY